MCFRHFLTVVFAVLAAAGLAATDSTGIRKARSGNQPDWVHSIASSPAMVVTGGGDSIIRGWWQADGRQIFSWDDHTRWIQGVAISPTGRHIASCSADKTIKIWTAPFDDKTSVKRVITIEAFIDWCTSVSFSNDGMRLIASSWDGHVRIYNITDATQAAGAKQIKAIEMATMGPQGGKKGSAATLAASEAMHKGTLMPFRDLDAEGIQDEMDELDGDEGKAIECVAWSSHPEDESVVVTAHKNGKVHVWDMVPETPKITVTFDAHSSEVMGCGISGDVVATGGKDHLVKVWSVKTGKLIHKFTGHWGEISAVRIRGDTVVSASIDLTVRIWSILTKEEVVLLDEYGYEAQINDMQISEIGIVSGGWDNTWHSTPWCHGHGSPNWTDTSCTCDEGYGGDRCDEWYHRQVTGHTKSTKPKHAR